MLESQHNLRRIKPRSILRKPPLLLQMMEQLPPALVVHDQIQIRLALKGKLQSEQEWTFATPLKNLAFADRMRHLLLRYNFPLREHLHRVDSVRILLSYLKDSTKCSLSDHSQEVEIVDDQSFLHLRQLRQLESHSRGSKTDVEFLVSNLNPNFSRNMLVRTRLQSADRCVSLLLLGIETATHANH